VGLLSLTAFLIFLVPSKTHHQLTADELSNTVQKFQCSSTDGAPVGNVGFAYNTTLMFTIPSTATAAEATAAASGTGFTITYPAGVTQLCSAEESVRHDVVFTHTTPDGEYNDLSINKDTTDTSTLLARRHYASCMAELHREANGIWPWLTGVVVLVFAIELKRLFRLMYANDFENVPHNGILPIGLHVAAVWLAMVVGAKVMNGTIYKYGPCAIKWPMDIGFLAFSLLVLGPLYEVWWIFLNWYWKGAEGERYAAYIAMWKENFFITSNLNFFTADVPKGEKRDIVRLCAALGVVFTSGYVLFEQMGIEVCSKDTGTYYLIVFLIFLCIAIGARSENVQDPGVSKTWCLFTVCSFLIWVPAMMVAMDSSESAIGFNLGSMNCPATWEHIYSAHISLVAITLAYVVFSTLSGATDKAMIDGQNWKSKGWHARPSTGISSTERLTKDKADLPGIQFV
jgi:hypothetical protein